MHRLANCISLLLPMLSLAQIDSTHKIKDVEIVRKQATKLEMTPRNVEVINSAGLVKDACCNLSESFVNSASVDVSYADAVSGAKEILLLGLDGSYSQIMIENIPAIRGLGNIFGLTYIPGPWMNSIQVNKGAGSVVNGYEAVTGQINIEFKKPQVAERLFVNGFLNQDARAELNIYTAHRLPNPKWITMLLTHGQLNLVKMDFNNDGFIDNPLIKEGNIMSRWTYQNGKGFTFISAASLLAEDRRGGQSNYDFDQSNRAQNYWGTRLATIKADAWAKTGFTVNNTSSVGLQYKYALHQQDGFIGSRDYVAREHFGYFNLIYQTEYAGEDNLIKLGISSQINDTREQLDSFHYQRLELVPGAFAEMSYAYQRKLSMIVGLRADYHSLYGPFITPRFNLKWNILYALSLRLAAGRGYHIPAVIAENYGLLANNRSLSITPNIKPEVAWNYGASLSYKYFIDFREGSITLDYYRTDFENQLIADIENVRQLHFYNLQGRSYSNSVQIEAQYEVYKGLDLKLAYKYDDVRSTYGGVLRQVPLKPRHKGLAAVEYVTTNHHWRFNSSLTWYGATRVPDTSPNAAENQRPTISKNFFLLNAQVTYTIHRIWEVYIGGENILNQTQASAIISNDKPQSKEFDASLIWGQLRGAMVFAGFRVSIK